MADRVHCGMHLRTHPWRPSTTACRPFSEPGRGTWRRSQSEPQLRRGIPPQRAAMAASHEAYQATDGAAYEVFLGRRSRRLAEALLDFADFADDGRLLDVGCGTGSLACAMAARWPGRRIVGVDSSEAFLAFARSRAGPVFDFGDATALPYDDAVFDGAATQLVLNFIPNAGAA